MTIKEIREKMGVSQSKFSKYFGIPIKTIQQWERNGSTPPPYIPEMIVRILDLEEKDGKGV